MYLSPPPVGLVAVIRRRRRVRSGVVGGEARDLVIWGILISSRNVLKWEREQFFKSKVGSTIFLYLLSCPYCTFRCTFRSMYSISAHIYIYIPTHRYCSIFWVKQKEKKESSICHIGKNFLPVTLTEFCFLNPPPPFAPLAFLL